MDRGKTQTKLSDCLKKVSLGGFGGEKTTGNNELAVATKDGLQEKK